MQEIISRSDAKRKGLNRYFTGKPCPHGHVVQRVVSSGACVQCKRDRNKEWKLNNSGKEDERRDRWRSENREKATMATNEWRKRNPGKHAEHQREYRDRNLEKERARYTKWLSENKEKMRAINARWYIENRDKVAARDARRRAGMLRATPCWDVELTALTVLEAADLSKRRKSATGFDWNVDHMIPLRAKKVCGLHTWSNIQVIPQWMNLKKNNKLIFTKPGEWIREACALCAP